MELRQFESYSQLFYSCDKGNLFLRKQASLQHPFDYLEDYINFNDEYLWLKLREFGYGKDIIQTINKKHREATEHFNIEHGILRGKEGADYLNKILNILLELYSLNKENYCTPTINLAPFLDHLIKRTIIDIFNYNHSEINGMNRGRIYPWLKVKPPLKSFRWHQNIEFTQNQLKRLYKENLIFHLIDTQTKFSSFKNVFLHRRLTNKINWVHKTSSLKYFIQQLIEKEVIENPSNKHWKITSEFFLVENEVILPSDFTKTQPTKNKLIKKKIDKFISALVSR